MDEPLPDLGAFWLRGAHATSTIVFDYFDLHMLARAGVGDYTSSRALVIDVEYMLTFEFDEERFKQLLRLLPKAGATQVARALGGPFVAPHVINIPPGAVVVGLRTRLGEPRVNPDETYVPFVVTGVFAPGPQMSIAFEDDDEPVDKGEAKPKPKSKPRSKSRKEPMGTLDLIETSSGHAHAICGVELRDGDPIDAWLKQEKDWVRGKYRPTTNAGAFEPKFALLETERTGMRPIFLNIKARRA